MAGLIPEETLLAIRDRISLVDVVSNYVSLKPAGRNHIGLCPFHDDKTPSFSVSDERGFFKCFGCGEGGDVFSFLMRVERVEFPEAVERLAQRAGVAMPERSRESGRTKQLRESLIEINEMAAAFFRENWLTPAGAAAREYMKSRGLLEETIERYAIGFAPSAGNALAGLLGRRKISRQMAVQSGVLGEREGRVYDRFRGRIMFPIRDRSGRVIAFGGRAMGDDQPKYLNSPETPIFTKGEGLYGISEAREAIREVDRVILVEGYMDALMLVQAGIPYTVATLGTALTSQQLRMLRRISGEQATLYFFFDGDNAGRKAALRAFGVCAESGVWGRPAFLPDDMDPDDFVRANGVEATLALLDKAPELLDYYFDAILPAGADMSERARATKEVKRILARVADPVHFEVLARRSAERLGVSEMVFGHARDGVSSTGEESAPPSTAWPAAEKMLMEAVALDEDVARWVLERDIVPMFAHPGLASATNRLIDAWETGAGIAGVLGDLPAEIADHLGRVLMVEGDDAGDQEGGRRRTQAHDCAERIRSRYESRCKIALMEKLRSAERSGDADSNAELLQLTEMIRRQGERA